MTLTHYVGGKLVGLTVDFPPSLNYPENTTFINSETFSEFILVAGVWEAIVPFVDPFLPTDISNLAAWFDASDEASVIRSGGAVSQWNDKSGIGNNLTQATTNDRPQFAEDFQNGLPLITFDGVNDFMDLTNFSGGALSQPNTAFVVCRIPTTTTTTNGVIWDTPTSNRNLFTIATLTQYRMFAGNNLSSGDALQTTVDQFSLFFNTTTSLMRRNQVEIIASGDAGSLTFEGLRLSAGTANDSFSNTEIGEMVIYDKLLNDTERDQVENYLKNKWNTP